MLYGFFSTYSDILSVFLLITNSSISCNSLNCPLILTNCLTVHTVRVVSTGDYLAECHWKGCWPRHEAATPRNAGMLECRTAPEATQSLFIPVLISENKDPHISLLYASFTIHIVVVNAFLTTKCRHCYLEYCICFCQTGGRL